MEIISFSITILTFAYIFLFIFHKGKYSIKHFEYLGDVVFSTVGTAFGIDNGYPPLISIFSGIVTALGGGTLRDIVILRRTPIWEDKKSIDLLIVILTSISMWIGRTYFSHTVIPGLS